MGDRLLHVTESQQFSREILYDLFERADKMRDYSGDKFKGRIMASLFYEPSTRTRLSFESAMKRLGGEVIGTENAGEFSSAKKGESLEDSIRVIGSYCDLIVLRHNVEGSAKKASQVSKVPVISAGDGKGQHPTQALLDVYTLYREFDRLDNLKIAMVGDLASGRTARSLCYLCSKFDDIELTFVSPDNLKMGGDIKGHLSENNVCYSEHDDLNNVLPRVDVVYMTRIQKERIEIEDYENARGKFVINRENLGLVREKSRIMHPLPHVEEIDLSIEIEGADERVAYFRQAENGLYARMALMDMILNGS
ncbi:aspartate carbamoyltransferase [Candidatus Pacearchaeota archaeon]|nr:aspartate carbamoyltransferase [Candidatus Pacearchaeota archaeon]|tara:strand:+ start:901 stop:1824 length:924 start_codon:yes stop_codon:yes gene_type:complete